MPPPAPPGATPSSPTRHGQPPSPSAGSGSPNGPPARRCPKGAGTFLATTLATTLATDPETVTRIGGNYLAATLLGVATGQYGRSSDLTAAIAKASDTRAQVLTLVLVLAGYDNYLSREDWRTVRQSPRRYLTYLASLGYSLSDVERRACGEEVLPT